MVDREFELSPNKALRLEEKENPAIKYLTIGLPYTRFRCSQIASNIHKILNLYTPLFKLRIAFTTIKLSRVILPRLKPKTNIFHKSNLVYQFNCPCSSVYIGETYRLLEHRIFEHRREEPSHIYQHLKNCSTYKSSLTDSYEFSQVNPNSVNI